ncbi:phosphoenolpyruvate synthase [Nanobdella aerobiophila]|uniref:Phosphoenolpyruvate synthase n=1 Tax=Nanobdella aerobiophila TaxID=2586965 RepID=A0A915WRE8_9ARCH|nr:PEP/pyruvate-binding domain-containing protein [Nanobdella aerobiophila]BBL45513.1 phosphoenolpyruvate synthase [Nanobdella aerobiophila]
MIIELSEDSNTVGNKAANLYKAKKMGINVPKSIVLPYDSIKKYNIEDILNELENKLKDYRRPLIFRSSANLEDLKDLSLAGVFESILNIYNREDMKNAIERILNSSKNAEKFGIRDVKMNILIQEQFTKGKFGVIFGFNDKIIIEVTVNDPTGITSGRAKIRDLYIIYPDSYIYYNDRNWKILFDYEINKIREIDKILRKIYHPYDAEFVLYKGDFYLLQIRPLTRKINISKASTYGIGVSYGKIIGRVTFDYNNIGKDKILVTDELAYDDIYLINKFGGIIIELGSLLSHVAIHAREYNVPAIVGISNNIFKEGELIEINGETGEIGFLERKGFELPKINKNIEVYNPRKLDLVIIDKYAFLIYPKDSYRILFYRDERGIDKLTKISEDPLVDGGVDTWHTYSVIKELSLIDSEVKNYYEKAIGLVDNNDISGIKNLYKELEEKIKGYYKIAEKSKDLYYAQKTYAFIRIHSNIIISEYGQKFVNNKEFLEFVKETEKYTIPELIKIYDLLDEIYKKYRKKGIDKKYYTSDLVLLIDVDKLY